MEHLEEQTKGTKVDMRRGCWMSGEQRGRYYTTGDISEPPLPCFLVQYAFWEIFTVSYVKADMQEERQAHIKLAGGGHGKGQLLDDAK